MKNRGMKLATCGAAAGHAGLLASASPALAHAADRGHVLLLPTGHYLVGGALAVAFTFIVLALVPPRPLEKLASARMPLGSLPEQLRILGSLASLALLICLLAAGWLGSRDPLSNPLPLMVWTVFWIGLTLLQGLIGNLWWWIDPWHAPARLAARMNGRNAMLRPMPRSFGYWPAVLLFAGFAWFELVYPAPDDPARLASVLVAYYLFNLGACIAFGHEEWSKRGECLSVFLRMIGRLGMVEAVAAGPSRRSIRLCLPAAKLASSHALPLSGALFLLLALSTVSFDGLMRTFFWLGLNGVNPLEFPGRSAVIGISSLGLAAMFGLLAAAFLLAVAAGERLSRHPCGFGPAAGLLVWSIIPISMAYHFSHYLTALAINGQYALAALSDPLMRGWDLFGTAGMHVQAGITMGAQSAWVIWNLQAGAIIAGHLLAVVAAHVIAFRLYGSERAATRSQAVLAALMVAYTVFGLWLLSSPTAA